MPNSKPIINPSAALYSAANPMPFIDLATQQARLLPKIEAAIKRVLAHGHYIMGEEVLRLETALAKLAGTKHCVTTSSGTDALMLGAMVLGIGEGKSQTKNPERKPKRKPKRKPGVIVPSFTFAATAEIMPWLGAVPVFADVEKHSFNLDPAGIDNAMAAAEKADVEVVGIIAVGLFGQPADMAALAKKANQHGVWLLDDAAQSFGSQRDGVRTGSLARVTATSFFPAKPLGCYGDGGALFTDDDAMAAIARSLRVHGMGQDRYQYDRIGMTGRLDSLQAAVLLEKLTIFDDELTRRQKVADGYGEAIAEAMGGTASDSGVVPRLDEGATSSWAQYTLRLPDGADRGEVQKELAAAGVPTAIYYPKGMHEQPPYQGYPVAEGGLPATADLCRRVLSLPCHPYVSEEARRYVVGTLVGSLKRQGVLG